MTPEVLLRDVLSDQEIKTKYKLTDSMIENARLAPPYDHQIIEYLATMIKASMDKNHGQPTVYNHIKNLIKIS